MASYFDEHDCEELGENERPNNDLLLARLLLDSGIANALGYDYDILTGLSSSSTSKLAPPASKQWLKETLEIRTFDETLVKNYQCPICLKEFINDANGDEEVPKKSAIKLPCSHIFHSACVLKWLEQTSSCPSCRHEYPTDDKNYEQFKQQKKREKERAKELESLHDSMYM